MNLYSIRRERIMKDIGDNSIIVLYSSDNTKTGDVFNVNRNFYYLTGIDEPSCVLLMTNIKDKITSQLFILPQDPIQAKWVGDRITDKEAKEISEIEHIGNYYEFDETFYSLLDRLRSHQDIVIYLDLWREEGIVNRSNMLAGKLRKDYPAYAVCDAFSIITQYRLIKDESEITCISRAIKITNAGVQNMMKNIRPGMNEMSLEGLFAFSLFQNKCNKTAFKTICASGPRATVLHYQENNQDTKDGELLLCDLGATYKNYCADISRTFPVNGRFTPRQKEIYNIVLNAQKIVEENAVVGTNIKKLTELVVDYYKTELPKHNLNKDVNEYFYHSVSHHLGLDIHDVDGGLGDELKAGMVITNEPGLYIADEGIGIRIEDDLLITSTGAKCLSSEIIKTPEDIENFMKKF